MSQTKQEKTKTLVAGVVMLVGVVALGVWLFAEDEGDFNMATPANAVVVPDGYAHTQTQNSSGELVHTYEKPAPQPATPTQTDEDAYIKYLESLPDELEKAIGQEFRTLSKAHQNAKLYANTTGLMRQAKENMLAIDRIEGKTEQKRANTPQPKPESLVVGAASSQSQTPTDNGNASSVELLDTLVVDGVVRSGNGYYAMVIDHRGRTHTLTQGQSFGDGLKVKKLSNKEVVITHGKNQRVFPIL